MGLYTTSEAARYLGLPVSTLQAWISHRAPGSQLVTTVARKGYRGRHSRSSVSPRRSCSRQPDALACRVIGSDQAWKLCKSELGLQHALASRLLYTDGAELLVRYAAADHDLEVARTRQRQLTYDRQGPAEAHHVCRRWICDTTRASLVRTGGGRRRSASRLRLSPGQARWREGQGRARPILGR